MQKRRPIPQNRQMIKYAVRMQMNGRFLYCLLACLIPALLPWVMRLIPVPLSFGITRILVGGIYPLAISLPVTGLVFLVSCLVSNPMNVRLAAYFLKVNRDPENLPSPIVVCDCFGPGYLRVTATMFLREVIALVSFVIPVAIGALIPGTWQMVEIEGASFIALGDSFSIFLMLGLALYIVSSITLSMVPYILADEPWLRPLEALRRSRYLTRGRMGELFILQLSFIGWNFLMQIVYMITSLQVAFPFVEGTFAAYYIAYVEQTPPEDTLYHAAG